MEKLKLIQYYRSKHHNPSLPKEKTNWLLEKVSVEYCIPDALPGKRRIWQRWSGYTSLHFAVMMDDVDLTNELLKRDADVVKRGTEDGRTALHIAVDNKSVYSMSGQLQKCILIETLLSRQVEINRVLNPKCEQGVSHLHIACIANHVEAVLFFVKAKENINQPIDCNTIRLPGYTPLHCAIEYSSVEAADILLQHGADVRIENAKGVSCLHMLIKRTMDLNDFIRMGQHTLCVPYEDEIERLKSIIDLMLKARAKDEIFLDDNGLTALHIACILSDNSALEIFQNKDIEVNLPVKSESKFCPGWTALHFAACFDIEVVMLLIHRGANILMKNCEEETVLDLCAKRFTPIDIHLILSMENQFKDIVLSDDCTKLSDILLALNNSNDFAVFLKQLKDVNIQIPLDSTIWPGYNLLHLSVSLNDRKKQLSRYDKKLDLPENVDPIERYNCTEDETALYRRRIELCLKYGCSVSVKNANGQTPIHLAFGMLREETVEQLLIHSTDNVVDQNGLSHLHIACVLGNLDAVKRYLSKGADVNSRLSKSFDWRDEFSRPVIVRANSTPLHIAVVFDLNYVIRYLVRSGANVCAQDTLGFTPIHLLMTDYKRCQEARELAQLLFRASPDARDVVASAVNLSHLHVAAFADEQWIVDKLLRGGAQVDRKLDASIKPDHYSGHTPLQVVLTWGSEKAVESLLRSGANEQVFVHSKCLLGFLTEQRYTDLPLSESSRHLHRLLLSGKLDVESTGMTLLHVACGNCDVEWTKTLLRKGADVNARISLDGADDDTDSEPPQGATPLYLLVREALSDIRHWTRLLDRQEFIRLVELFVNSGADVTIVACGRTPLYLIYEYLRDNLDSKNDYYYNLMSRAGDLLLQSYRHYDVNHVDRQGFSPFHFACVRNDVQTAKKFLDHGVDVNLPTDPFAGGDDAGFTPLHFAMDHQNKDIIHLLLDRGADVNAEDANGNKPLHIAVKKKLCDLSLIETMHSHGADIHARNLKDETLLYCLLKRSDLTLEGYLSIIKFFMDNGFDLDQRDTEGTPLQEAAHSCNLYAINALLQLGADINVVDDNDEYTFFKTTEAANKYSGGYIMDIFRALACHVWKMRFNELEVEDSNLRSLEIAETKFQLTSLLGQSCQNELMKAKETKICQDLTVENFLSELGAVAVYRRMNPVQQANADKFFNATVDLHREFPEFCGLLALQYRKALARIKLAQPAKQAIISICRIEFPDLCLESILRYLTNSEMKYVIELSQEVFV